MDPKLKKGEKIHLKIVKITYTASRGSKKEIGLQYYFELI